MSAASDYSAHQKSPPGLCSLFWSPSDILDLNVSDILFPPFFRGRYLQTGQFYTPSRQILVHCALLGPPYDVTGRLHPLIRRMSRSIFFSVKERSKKSEEV